jgi:hypothetical protein
MTLSITITTKARMRTLSADLYAGVLKHAWDPLFELGRFQESLRSSAHARLRALGEEASDDLRFANDELLRIRIHGAQRHLKRSLVAGTVLADFLRYAEELATEAIDAAETADEIAEALVGALDSLHAYLLTHDLVEPGYREAEEAHVKRLLSRSVAPDPPEEPEEVGLEVPTAAAKNDLALAA